MDKPSAERVPVGPVQLVNWRWVLSPKIRGDQRLGPGADTDLLQRISAAPKVPGFWDLRGFLPTPHQVHFERCYSCRRNGPHSGYPDSNFTHRGRRDQPKDLFHSNRGRRTESEGPLRRTFGRVPKPNLHFLRVRNT